MKREYASGRRARLARRLALGGFTLLEALIALAIGGFGLIAVARLQIGLQNESDLAKQVSEATFLGQRRIEELRSYMQLASATGAQIAAGQWGYGNIATGSQTVTGSNAVYTVGWTVTDAAANVPYKAVAVNVQWTDRRNVAQVATLSTVISGSDPSASLGLAIPPAGTPIRRPKNRDLNVPVPATDLGNGTSAFTPPGAPNTFRLVFNNVTGLLTQKCNLVTTSWVCSDITAYLVTGYISVNSQAPASLNSPIDLSWAMVAGEGSLDSCYDDSGASTKTYSGFITYTCVINGKADANPLQRFWSGRSTLTGITIGNTKDDNKVCRYSYDYNANGTIENSEHPNSYSHVLESLENQNFIIMKGNAQCPSGASSVQVTVQHQP